MRVTTLDLPARVGEVYAVPYELCVDRIARVESSAIVVLLSLVTEPMSFNLRMNEEFLFGREYNTSSGYLPPP